jgi:uncharacterized membrane protein YphA (DoxX/SURF4 family)
MTAKRLALWMLALLLAAFFGFVGWNKAFASLTQLATYGAWTVHLPEVIGRAVGWSELVCAAALLVPRTRMWSALLLIANQFAAAAVHFTQGELAALPQNAVLVALLAIVAFLARTPRGTGAPGSAAA